MGTEAPVAEVEPKAKKAPAWDNSKRGSYSSAELAAMLEEKENAPAATDEPKAEAKPEQKEEAPKAKTEIEIIREELEKVKKELANKELIFQRQANELGEHRKKSKSEPKGEESDGEELPPTPKQEDAGDDEDPVSLIEDKTKYRSYHKKLAQEAIKEFVSSQVVAEHERRQSEREMVTKVKEEIHKSFPNFESELVEEIVSEGKEEGDTEEVLSAFRENPYAVPLPTLRLLAKNAKQRRALREAEAKLNANGSASKLLTRTLAKASSLPNTVNGKSAVSSSGEKVILTREQLASMTPAELATLLEQHETQ